MCSTSTPRSVCVWHTPPAILQAGADEWHLQEGVQDASKACAVLVGQKEMCQAVTEMLVQHGVSKDHILLNF